MVGSGGRAEVLAGGFDAQRDFFKGKVRGGFAQLGERLAGVGVLTTRVFHACQFLGRFVGVAYKGSEVRGRNRAKRLLGG